jgi:nicotinamidase-related amidase
MSNGADHRVLLVVDPLKRFTEAGAPFEAPGAAEIVARTNVAVAACREQGVPVVWTTRMIRPQVGMGSRTGEKYGAIPDAFLGRWAELDDRLDVRADDVVIDKTRHSAFYQTDLEGVLRTWGTREVLLAGFTTNVCMLATAFDAVARDLRVVLLADLSGTRGTTYAGEEVSAAEIQRMTEIVLEYAVGTVSTSAVELAPVG